MSTGSLSTRRAAGWMKIDRENEGQEGEPRRRFGCLGEKKQKGVGKGCEDVRGGRAPRLNSASGVLA